MKIVTPDHLMRSVRAFEPWNEQERLDQMEILRQIAENRDIFTRENRNAHMTASAWLVNQDLSKVLMVFHNLYNSWSWIGGHADGEVDLLRVAVREAQEETGLLHVWPVSEDIFSLEILTVDGHEKHGEYVSSHLHLNLTYLLMADENDELISKADENSAVAWFLPDEAVAASCEPWFQKRIYPKLNQKLLRFIHGS